MKQRLSENCAAFTCGLGLLTSAMVAGLVPVTGLLSFSALLPLLFMLIAVSLLVFIRLRLERLSEDEKRDQALLAKEKPESSLFQSGEPGEDPFSIGRSRRQVESFIMPWIAPLLGLAQIYWAWRLYNGLPWDISDPRHLALSSALLGSLAFLLFLVSRFVLGLSRHTDSRLLRGPGVLAGLLCWGALLGLAGAIGEHYGFERADDWAARILIAAVALLGLENLLHSLLRLYSHQRERAVTTYESKWGALLVDPGVLTRSMTEAMDYQFGFSFSQTWFFKIIQKAIMPLLVLQALLLYAMSCFVFLAPHETGILERFGKPVAREATLGSGFHLKRPWPFETVRRIPTGRILLIEVGFESDGRDHHPAVMTWTVPHYRREDVFLVASRSAFTNEAASGDQSGVPVSMITVNVPVEYRITNAFAYAYRYADPENMLRQMIYQTITRQLAHRDLGELFSEKRGAISQEMRHELQAAADRLELGVLIEFFGIQGVHPPVPVAAAFQSVVGALEEKEAAILEARAYTNQILPLARAYAYSTRVEAEAFRHRRKIVAEAEGRQFEQRLLSYRKSPHVYRAYHYLDMLQHAAAPSRLYVLDLPGQGSQTLWLNLEEKQFSGVLDMAPMMLEGGH